MRWERRLHVRVRQLSCSIPCLLRPYRIYGLLSRWKMGMQDAEKVLPPFHYRPTAKLLYIMNHNYPTQSLLIEKVAVVDGLTDRL